MSTHPCNARYYDLDRTHGLDGHQCGRFKEHDGDHRCGVAGCTDEWQSYAWVTAATSDAFVDPQEAKPK